MKCPALMGIVNLTTDSFSGDGQLDKNALEHAAQLVADGADILDIGAESTRPGATPLSAEEEWARLMPFLTELQTQPWRSSIRVSLDTRHAATALRALDFGVEMINDVGGLSDPAMVKPLRAYSCDIVVMHALSIPADPAQVLPADADVVEIILQWRHSILTVAARNGIAAERLIFDPGLGFGKTARQSLALVLHAQRLVHTGGRWLFGHSRKSFLTLFGAYQAAERDALTLAFSAQLAAANVDYLRVHHVAAHRTLWGQLCI